MKRTTLLCCIFSCLCTVLFAQDRTFEGSFPYYENSIVSATLLSEDHTTLWRAFKLTNLDQSLDKNGPFTVFAPSDSAFDKLSADQLDHLFSPENSKELFELINYHILPGQLSATQILKALVKGEGMAIFTTITGETLTAGIDGIDIVIEDSFGNQARIISADGIRCNGIVHVIDNVVLPAR